jgi:site-specific DNA recombinase
MVKLNTNRRRRKGTSQMAVGYARVSTTGQAEDGQSIDAQTVAIQTEAQRLGLDLVDVFTDEGVSGRRGDRMGLHAALSIAINNGAVLICYSLSRLSRSNVQTLQVVEALDAAGAHLVLIQEGINTTGTCGRMMLGVLAAVYQHQVEASAETTSAVLRHVRASGRKTGGSVPYGFTADADGTLHVHAGERRVIDRMVELRRQRVSYRRIAAKLDAEGLAPRGVTSSGKPSSGRWQLRQVVRILDREAAL